ncbi:hypothetical protein B0F86_03490 [Pseudomonas syringae]|nr:hypothetical protein B0F86_03490 [Pseudomonas syringae]
MHFLRMYRPFRGQVRSYGFQPESEADLCARSAYPLEPPHFENLRGPSCATPLVPPGFRHRCTGRAAAERSAAVVGDG